MRKRILLGALALLVMGCGGGGTDAASSFAGTYSGTWDSPGSSESGTALFTVDAQGAVSGSMDRLLPSLEGQGIQGTIDARGRFSGVWISLGMTGPLVAIFSQTPAGMSGSMVRTMQGGDVAGTFTLAKR